jgi:hypothetical protein
MIELKNLSKHYRKIILNNVDLPAPFSPNKTVNCKFSNVISRDSKMHFLSLYNYRSDKMIELKNLSKHYRKKCIFESLDMTFEF